MAHHPPHPGPPDSRQVAPPVHAPYVPAGSNLPELTVKAVVLGALLAVVLGAANAYLGLLAGMTVSASIPAAVLSMAVLRLFRKSNILENNLVQTAASAGESLAAGVIFTFPALILLGAWQDFRYGPTTVIAAIGGLLGVLFTVPLRRALVVEARLRYPEGVATAEVLKVGDQGGNGVRALAWGGCVGALFKFGSAGLGLWTQALEGARQIGRTLVYGGSNLLPSLVAVGYIVGLNIAVLIFLGGALNWFVAIPIHAALHPWPEGTSALDHAWSIWSRQTRYIGVGAMVVGGLWALVRMGRPIVSGIRSGLRAYRDAGTGTVPVRTERDLPMKGVLIALALAVVPLFVVFRQISGSYPVAAAMAVIMLFAGFLFSAVAAYMAGLVGSSNNPVSGVTIATILLSSLLLLAMLGSGAASGPAAAILIGAVVCCAAAIGGDNLQDLKSGHLLGATPRHQQWMQIVGVLAAALVMAPVLSLLLRAYGIAVPAGPDHPPLPAPQATLMASVARGVFERNLPWPLVAVGAGIAVLVILLDLALERRNTAFRCPVLAVAVGIYLPLELATPILLGGVIARAAGQRAGATPSGPGLLFAAGLITGEAVLGILLAIPIALREGRNPLQIVDTPLAWPGLLLLVAVAVVLLRIANPRLARDSSPRL